MQIVREKVPAGIFVNVYLCREKECMIYFQNPFGLRKIPNGFCLFFSR